MGKDKPVTNAELIEHLNNTLKLEYSLIVQYPQLANRIKDSEVKKLAQELGIASIAHADTVANAIKKLGGRAVWSFEPLPEEDDLVKIFQLQLEKEKTALQMHQKAAGMVGDSQLKEQLAGLAKEERSHIGIAEEIIARLEQ
jgi:bacterioferritin